MSPDPYDPNDFTSPSNRPEGSGGPSNAEIWDTIARQREAQRETGWPSYRWLLSPRSTNPTKARWFAAVLFAVIGFLFASATDEPALNEQLGAAAIFGLIGYFLRAIIVIIGIGLLIALIAYWMDNG